MIRTHVMICGGTGCTSSDSPKIAEAMEQEIVKLGLQDEVKVVRTGCFGLCEMGPVMIVYPDGTFYSRVKVSDVPEIASEHLLKGRIVERLVHRDVEGAEQVEVPTLKDIEFYKPQLRVALRNCGVINPEDVEEYIAMDGYAALGKVLTEMTPEQVIDVVTKSGLRGRGGAGFPTGKKWLFASFNKTPHKYVVCNADEGDPGAFMDRSVLEGDPHAILEAMCIAGYAINANQGYIYVRAEYPIAVHRLQIAIKQAREYGLLGKDIFGTGFDFDIDVRLGAGAFVCGEETALSPRPSLRSPPTRASLVSPPSSTTWRPWPTSPRSSSRAPSGSLPWAPRAARAPRCSRWAARSTTPVLWKFLWAPPSARSSTISAAASPMARPSRRSRPAVLPAAASRPSSWICPSTMRT